LIEEVDIAGGAGIDGEKVGVKGKEKHLKIMEVGSEKHRSEAVGGEEVMRMLISRPVYDR
jgi:hypothetical protein